MRVEIDRDRAPNLRSRPSRSRRRSLGVGGDDEGVALPRSDVNEDYDVTIRLTENYRGRAT